MKIVNRSSFICVLFSFLAAQLFADVSGIFVPNAIRTNKIAIPSNAPIALKFFLPPAPIQVLPPASPATSTNFAGGDDNHTYYPPDTMGAVGTNRLVVMLNGLVRIQTRSGASVSSTNLNGWWNSVGPFSDANFVFDPHVVYDPFNDRWIATAVANGGTSSAELLIGVSATGDPAGNWYRYAYLVDSSATYWADYPLLGFNRDKIVVTFTYAAIQAGAPDNGSGLVVYDKASLYAGNTPVSGSTYSFTFLGGASFGYNMVPAITYDTNQSTMYLVESINGNFNNAGYLVV